MKKIFLIFSVGLFIFISPISFALIGPLDGSGPVEKIKVIKGKCPVGQRYDHGTCTPTGNETEIMR